MVDENNDQTATSGSAGEIDEGIDATGSEQDASGASGGKDSLLHKLYVGTGAFNIVGNRRRWFLMFATLVVVCIVVIGVRGFDFGIDFEGGPEIQVRRQGAGCRR